MKEHRVDQTILATDPKRQGNCLAACVASWLGLSLAAVPHFIEEHDGWWPMLVGYMSGHGLWPLELENLDDADEDEIVFVMGMSPRGVCHQVLYRDGALWHDPHPSRDGLTDVREIIAWREMRHDHTPTVVTNERAPDE